MSQALIAKYLLFTHQLQNRTKVNQGVVPVIQMGASDWLMHQNFDGVDRLLTGMFSRTLKTNRNQMFGLSQEKCVLHLCQPNLERNHF